MAISDIFFSSSILLIQLTLAVSGILIKFYISQTNFAKLVQSWLQSKLHLFDSYRGCTF